MFSTESINFAFSFNRSQLFPTLNNTDSPYPSRYNLYDAAAQWIANVWDWNLNFSENHSAFKVSINPQRLLWNVAISKSIGNLTHRDFCDAKPSLIYYVLRAPGRVRDILAIRCRFCSSCNAITSITLTKCNLTSAARAPFVATTVISY